MLGLGIQEIIIILVVALIVIGPKKLPELARGLGKAMREFRSATNDIKQNFDLDPSDLTPRSNFNSIQPPKKDVNKDTEKDNKEKIVGGDESKQKG
jgi:sec-independent protein translocase protein TatB